MKDRLAVNIIEAAERNGTLKPGPNHSRGDQRQHRHRSCHGVRPEGLPAGGHHGRQLLDRAAQADAYPRRQGGADAARPEGFRHVPEGGRTERRPTAGSWRTSSRRPPTPTSTRPPRGARSLPTSRTNGWTSSSPATAPAAPWPVSRVCCERNGRRRRLSFASRPMRSLWAAVRLRSAAPTARRQSATRPSSRIRSRDGRPTSFRWYCRRRSTRSTSISAWPSPALRA